jgi:colanic acid/amylovoran biosynthesis glycosyltransferase
LDKKPYDIIHCHFGPSGLFGILLKSVGVIKGKLITSFHAYDLTSYLNQNEKNIYKKLFEMGDLFQPVSDYWKNELIQLGCKEEKINVHRMGIDLSKFSFSTTRYNDLSRIRFLSVNRLVEKKGTEYSIKAFARIAKKYPNLEYSIVGDGPLKNELLNLIEKLNVKNNISILGWLQQHDIQDLMDRFTILLAPSITDRDGEKEGIPVVLMEAMAKGLAVISTYHSGIPELINDNETGFLVKEKDVDGLANKMEYFILNPDKIEKFAIEARKVIEKYYNIQKLNKILLNTYHKMVYS